MDNHHDDPHYDSHERATSNFHDDETTTLTSSSGGPLSSRGNGVASITSDAYRHEREYQLRQKLQRQQELDQIKEIEVAESAKVIMDRLESSYQELKEKLRANDEDDVGIIMRDIAELSIPILNHSLVDTCGGDLEQEEGLYDDDAGGIQIILTKVAQQYRSNVSIQTHCIQVLAALAVEYKQFRNRIAENGGIETVISAMRAFPNDVNLAGCGCLALANLAMNDKYRVSVVSQGGIPLVVQAMNTFPDNNLLQQYGCLTISMTALNEENRTVIGNTTGAMDVLIQAMTGFATTDSRIQRNACLALGSLVLNEKNRTIIGGRLGGIERITDAMKNFPTDELVQHNSCLAIGNLAEFGVENRVAIAKHGGIELVVKAMTQFPKQKGLQKSGLVSLANLAFRNEENRVVIANKGGLELVLSAMDEFPSDAPLQMHSCTALGDLVSDQVVGAWSDAEVERCISHILGTMERFPSDSNVLRSCCYALESWVSVESSQCRSYIETNGGFNLARNAWREVLTPIAKRKLASEISTIPNRIIFGEAFLAEYPV